MPASWTPTRRPVARECVAPGDPGCSGNPFDGEESYTAGATRVMATRIDYVWARPSAGCALTATAPATVGATPALQDDGRWLWPSDHLGFRATVAC